MTKLRHYSYGFPTSSGAVPISTSRLVSTIQRREREKRDYAWEYLRRCTIEQGPKGAQIEGRGYLAAGENQGWWHRSNCSSPETSETTATKMEVHFHSLLAPTTATKRTIPRRPPPPLGRSMCIRFSEMGDAAAGGEWMRLRGFLSFFFYPSVPQLYSSSEQSEVQDMCKILQKYRNWHAETAESIGTRVVTTDNLVSNGTDRNSYGVMGDDQLLLPGLPGRIDMPDLFVSQAEEAVLDGGAAPAPSGSSSLDSSSGAMDGEALAFSDFEFPESVEEVLSCMDFSTADMSCLD
uniref:Uncharacterized protein n=1 Tax=Oryza punctata TaxID=4537 RepID=A0A0E0L146_ORYPU